VKTSNSKLETKDLRQDVDALDTWFPLGFGQCLFWWNNGS
jgi:hypothetical protein